MLGVYNSCRGVDNCMSMRDFGCDGDLMVMRKNGGT